VIEATLVFPLLSAVLAGLGIPLWVAMVKPNRFYGLRTAATLKDEALWYAANRATGRDLVVSGFLLLLLSVSLPLEGVAYALLMTGALLLASALVVLIALARVRRLRI
jgi:uncharacterized membrane protein